MPPLMRPSLPLPPQLACGERIPYGNIHAVSMNLPKVPDVTGYEEKLTETLSRLKAGYPRFVAHAYVEKILDLKTAKHSGEKTIFLVNSEKAGREIIERFALSNAEISIEYGIAVISANPTEALIKEILAFIQHTGCLVSSRKAENYLWEHKLIESVFQENKIPENAVNCIKEEFRNIYAPDDIETILTVSGMNAIYAGFRSIDTIQKKENKNIWIRLGWLYVDNIHLLGKYAEETKVFQSVHDLDSLEIYLKEKGNQVAGLLTEIPTNPLIQVPDLDKLRNILLKYKIPLVADISMAGSVVVNVIPYADVIVESLTKFAGGNADVMMGAIILNRKSPLYSKLTKEIHLYAEDPYEKDAGRMAFLIQNYKKRMKCISENTIVLANYFSQNKRIHSTYWCGSPENKPNFQKISRENHLVCGVISIVPGGKWQNFYDNLMLYKGPSFGTEFTLNMLYMYLAHYELVTDPSKAKILNEAKLSPELMRISVGCELTEKLIEAFENALSTT